MALRTYQESQWGQGVQRLALDTLGDHCLPLQDKQPSEFTFVSLALAVPQRHKQTSGQPVEVLPCPGGKTSHEEVT